MIRLLQRKLIIPRGDTGTFSIPALAIPSAGDIAIFSILDKLTQTKIFEKKIELTPAMNTILVEFTHGDTVNLKPGSYLWDIKIYHEPQYANDELIDAAEIHSYYAGFSLPECEIRPTADQLLMADDAPTSTLSPESLNVINAAINEALKNKNITLEASENAENKAAEAFESAENAAEFSERASQSAELAEARVNEIENLSVEISTGTEGSNANVLYTPATGVLSFEIPRGDTGNGIASCILNADFTLTINYTDGTSMTTVPIRGDTPHLTIGEVTEGPNAIATITGTDANPILNLTLPNANVPTRVSQLENDSNYAVDANYVHTDNNYTTTEKEKLSGIAAGAEVNVNADWNATSGDAQILNKPTNVSAFINDAGYLTAENDPTVPAWAKAAQKPSYTAAEVGAPTVQEMNSAISTAIGNVNSFDMAVVQALPAQDISTHTIYLVPKTGETNDIYDEYVYINNAWEMIGNTQIDLSDYALKSELPTNVSELSNDSGYLTSYTEIDPTVPQWAKAVTKPSYTATEVGALPSDTHIPSTTAELTNDAGFITVEEVPEVPVQDVQVNGVSVLSDGVANVPNAQGDGNNAALGVVKAQASYGIGINGNGDGGLRLYAASEQEIKNESGLPGLYHAIVPFYQHTSVFYGLAKAAGSDEKNSTLPVGQYTDAAKEAIQHMLGITQMLAPTNPNLVASQPYAIGDVFAANGHLYKATAAIEQDRAIIPDTNCVETTMVDAGGRIKDVQVNGVSIVSNGMANVPIANDIGRLGVIKIVQGGQASGLTIDGNGNIYVAMATDASIKGGANIRVPIVPSNQHAAAFYGLSKVAGVDLANETVTLGTYPETSKTAIKEMLGVQDGLKVVRLI